MVRNVKVRRDVAQNQPFVDFKDVSQSVISSVQSTKRSSQPIVVDIGEGGAHTMQSFTGGVAGLGPLWPASLRSMRYLR